MGFRILGYILLSVVLLISFSAADTVWNFDFNLKTEFVQTYGGNSFDRANDIHQNSDDGYIITGFTRSNDGDFDSMWRGEWDIFLIKTDPAGNKEWSQTYGGSGDEMGTKVIQTNDGGFLLTGWTDSNDGDFAVSKERNTDIFIIKTDSYGSIEWKRTWSGSGFDSGFSLVQADDGNILLLGRIESDDGDFAGMKKSYSDMILIKINSAGETIWKKTYSGNKSEDSSSFTIMEGRSITGSNDGGFIITGWKTPHSNDISALMDDEREIFVLKIDTSGDRQWMQTFGGSKFDVANSIIPSANGGYILTGFTESNDGDFSGLGRGESDIFLIKIDENGSKEWVRSLGGSDSEIGESIVNANDGGYYVTGWTQSTDGIFSNRSNNESDIVVIKLNSDGEEEWIQTYGGNNMDQGLSSTGTPEGALVLTGFATSSDDIFNIKQNGFWDIFIMKLSPESN